MTETIAAEVVVESLDDGTFVASAMFRGFRPPDGANVGTSKCASRVRAKAVSYALAELSALAMMQLPDRSSPSGG